MTEAVERLSGTAEPFPTVALRDRQSSMEALFVPALGMLCCSLRHRGEELLAQNAGLDVYAQRGKTMGIPLLYPWANRLAGFHYSVAGRDVTVPNDPQRIALDGNGMPIHGVIGGRVAWDLTCAARQEPASAEQAPASMQQKPASGEQRLTARLRWDETRSGLFEVFPFRHEVEYEARLEGERLEVTITVHACHEDPVPVAFGFHPYFTLPGVAREGWLVELPAMRPLALDERQIPLGPAGARLSARSLRLAESTFDDGFDEISLPARFAVSSADRRIALEAIEGYPCAQLYAPPGRDVVCFEPMTAPANALLSGEGLRVLAPGEHHRARFAVSYGET
jgi:galactose mutarotase-like enzyme